MSHRTCKQLTVVTNKKPAYLAIYFVRKLQMFLHQTVHKLHSWRSCKLAKTSVVEQLFLVVFIGHKQTALVGCRHQQHISGIPDFRCRPDSVSRIIVRSPLPSHDVCFSPAERDESVKTQISLSSWVVMEWGRQSECVFYVCVHQQEYLSNLNSMSSPFFFSNAKL